ncbi:heat shock factor protein 5 [Echinops telfairi]|uniref:Heat shock factor protein 5 n=1 Tax=Echinops telfairi TaxID=9371 RepID=A0AC55DU12_ECHTE|nr:heat shock factor protein 5 [Echinops telfairi]
MPAWTLPHVAGAGASSAHALRAGTAQRTRAGDASGQQSPPLPLSPAASGPQALTCFQTSVVTELLETRPRNVLVEAEQRAKHRKVKQVLLREEVVHCLTSVYYAGKSAVKLVTVLSVFHAGPVTVGQFHRSLRRDSLSPYSYVSTSSHNHSTFPLKGLDRTPIPPRTWQNSLGMHPGQVETSPTFSDKGVPFPVLQRFPTEVTYTLQPSATSVHVQQGPQTMVSSSQKYSNYTPSAQYSQAYYPTAVLQCCSPSTHMDALSSCVSPTASSYAHCNYFQNPPMQSSYPVEFLPSNWSCSATDENKKTEVNLEAVFQIVDELHSSPKLEMVKVEPVENQCPTSQSNRGQHLLANSNSSHPSSASQASQLEPLTPVGSDITSFVVGTEQAITCSLPQSPEYIYTIHTAQPVENTTVQESAAIQQAHVKLKDQLSHHTSPSSVVFVQEGLPFSTHQVDASIKCQTNPSENILPSEQMGFLISDMGSASKPSKDASLSTPARCRERRSNSQPGKSPDLHLLVDVACKQEHFPKEEELKE